MLFFQSISLSQKDRLHNTISDLLDSNLNEITGEQVIVAMKSAKFSNSLGDPNGYNWDNTKLFFTVGGWGIYTIAKGLIRDELFSKIESRINSTELSPRNAIFEVLSSIIGGKDKYSVKYLFVEKLFNLDAQNDIEAETMVDSILNYLENSENNLEMITIVKNTG